MKKCNKCKLEQTVDSFHNNKKTKDGKDHYCKQCRHLATIQNNHRTNKKCSLDDCNTTYYAKGYCRKHYVRVHRNGTLEKKNLTWQERTEEILMNNGSPYLVDKLKEMSVVYRYGIDFETYKQMTSNGCNICGVVPEYTLHIDHDHSHCTNTKGCPKCVRGALCARCNSSVGFYEANKLNKNYPIYEKIEQYVIKHGTIV